MDNNLVGNNLVGNNLGGNNLVGNNLGGNNLGGNDVGGFGHTASELNLRQRSIRRQTHRPGHA